MTESTPRAWARPLGLCLIGAAILGVWLPLHQPASGNFFHNPDDWYFLGLCRAVELNEPGALSRLLTGHGLRAYRPMGAALWLLNWLGAGLDASAYYLTNVLLSGGVASLVFALCWTLTSRPDRNGQTGSPERRLLAAFVAAALVSLAPSTNQGVLFLSARDDYLCTGFMVASLAVWIAGRGLWSSLGASVLLLCACGGKPIALVGPAIMVAVDVWTGRLPTRERVPWLRLVPPALAVLAYASFARPLLTWFIQGAGSQARGTPSLGVLLQNLQHAFLQPFVYEGALVRPALLVALVLAGAAARTVDWRLLGAGLTWIVINLAGPWSSITTNPGAARFEGRYLLLPSVGFALAAAALIASRPRSDRGHALWRPTAAVVLLCLGATVLEYRAAIWPMLSFDKTRASVLVRDLEQLDREAPPGARALIGIQHFDTGLLSALGSSVLPSAAPTLGTNIQFFLEGDGQLWEQPSHRRSPDVWDGYVRASSALDIDRAAADPGTILILERATGAASGEGRDGSIWLPIEYAVAPPIPPLRPPDGDLPRWSFAAGAQGWAWQSLAGDPFHQGAITPEERGLLLTQPPVGPDQGGMVLGRPGWTEGLVSPPLALEAATVCAITVEMLLPRAEFLARGHDHDIRVYPGGVALALTWSGATEFETAWPTVLMPPFSAGEAATARIELAQSPTWRLAGTVRRIALRPLAGDSLVIRSVALEGCPGPAEGSP